MATHPKLHPLDALVPILDRHRTEGKRIVHCHGVFDLLHIGHVRHFEQARKLGDVLVVTLTPDRFVNKGIGRPAFTETLRAEFLAALGCVDYVAINRWPTAVDTIHLLRPHVFAKGSEFKTLQDTIGHVSKEGEAVRSIGGEIAFTEDIVYSSSALINQYLSQYPDHVREFLGEFAGRFTAEEVLAPLRAAEGLKVLVVGEAIVDEYAYCEAIGKSGKEPVLATRYLGIDRFGGGALACANHAAGFASRVDVFTMIGEGGDGEEFVRGVLRPNVTPILFEKPNSPTIVKKRYVEKYLAQKMFEVYRMNDEALDAAADADLCGRLRAVLPEYDLVIVADYGHGMLTPNAVRTLCEHAKFLAVNTQSNAGNHGFNLISKYPRADYVCLAQREVALETRSHRLTPDEMVRHVADTLHCPRVMMTRGSAGTLFYTAPDEIHRVPALATKVVDRVGAGDAVLCVTALAVAAGARPEVVPFLGNVVGAEAVTILGNQRAVERIPMYRHVECLLKLHKAEPQAPTTLKLAG
ncbi:MAG: adenylyltransferase/cytidyltransferase family protein [Gemmataceae bacterium]|nr:adenylyltransferase/cytidyltransferase family protein [Gemmataceae bacterium]